MGKSGKQRKPYLRVFALIPISFFLILLVGGLLYEWKKGALDWE